MINFIKVCIGLVMALSFCATGFMGMLTILFVGLKLTHYITWSWGLVISPLWLPSIIGAAIIIVLVAILGMVLGGCGAYDKWRKK